MTTTVKFELAQLLKEKGYDVPTLSFYFKNGAKGNGGMPFNWNHYKHEYSDFSAPTIAEVVMWLYEKHGIWIIADPVLNFSCFIPRCFTKDNTSSGKYNGQIEFNSPTEAYEAAIEYTLNNLI